MPTLPAPIEVEASGEFLGNDGAWSPFLIKVGNPPTELRVLASTETAEAWVVFPAGCDNQTCIDARGGVFDKKSSKNWATKTLDYLTVESNLGYTGNSDNGEYGHDTLAIGMPGQGNVSLDQQLIAGIATKDFFLGNVGLANGQRAFPDGTRETGLMAQLKSMNLIPSLSYGYTAGASYQKSNASLTLGGYDASRFTPNDVTFTFGDVPSRSRLVALQAVVATDSNSETSLLDQPILALVDSTVPHIWLPEQSCKAFEKAFGITHDVGSDLYLINDTIHDALLKRDASISFQLSNTRNGGPAVNITLPYASFDLNVTGTVPYVRSPSRYFPLRRAQSDSQYTLGRTFFQESYLSVNYESQNFSVSQSLFPKDSARHIVPVQPAETQRATSSPTTSPISPTSTASSTLPPITTSTSHPSHSLGTPAIAGIAIAIVLLAIAGGIGAWLLFKRKRASKRQPPELAADPTFPHDKAELENGENGKPPGSSNDQKYPRTSVEEASNEKIQTQLDQREINIMDGNDGIHSTHCEVGGSEVLTPELPSPDPFGLGPHELSSSEAQLMRSELSTPEPGWVPEMPSPEMASAEMPSPEIGGTAAGERSSSHGPTSSTLLPPGSAYSKHRPRSRRPVHGSIDSSESEGGGTRNGKAPASARQGTHSPTYTVEPFEARQQHGWAHDRVPSSASSRQRPQHMRVDSTDSESAFPSATFKSVRSIPAHVRVDSSDSESFPLSPQRHSSLPTSRPPHRRLDSKDSTETMETRLEQSPPGSPWFSQATRLARDRPMNQSSQEALVSPSAASLRSGLRSPEPLERELMEEDEDEDRSTDSETRRREEK